MRSPKRAPRAAAETLPRLVPMRKTGKPGKSPIEIGNYRGNVSEMIAAQPKLIAHTPTALLIRRRVEDRRDHPALDELSTATDQEITAGKLWLSALGAKLDSSA